MQCSSGRVVRAECTTSEPVMSSIVGVIRAGWMVKSPPEKKLYDVLGIIYQVKWRRRWFVLARRDDEAGSDLPFELVYYEDETCRKCKGRIELDSVYEIVVNFDGQFASTFAIKTKQRNSDRTYYLSVAGRNEMMSWVQMLCACCGLSQQDGAVEKQDGGASSSTATNAIAMPSSVARNPACDDESPRGPRQENVIRAPEPLVRQSDLFTSHSNVKESPRASQGNVEDSSPYINSKSVVACITPAAPPVPQKQHENAARPAATKVAPAPDYIVLRDCAIQPQNTPALSSSQKTANANRSENEENDDAFITFSSQHAMLTPSGSDYQNMADAAKIIAPSRTREAPQIAPKRRGSTSRDRILAISGASKLTSQEFEPDLLDESDDSDDVAKEYVRPTDMPAAGKNAARVPPLPSKVVPNRPTHRADPGDTPYATSPKDVSLFGPNINSKRNAANCNSNVPNEPEGDYRILREVRPAPSNPVSKQPSFSQSPSQSSQPATGGLSQKPVMTKRYDSSSDDEDEDEDDDYHIPKSIDNSRAAAVNSKVPPPIANKNVARVESGPVVFGRSHSITKDRDDAVYLNAKTAVPSRTPARVPIASPDDYYH